MNAAMTDMSAIEDVEISRRNQTLVITLNRPAARNAVTKAMAQTIASVIDDFTVDDSLHVAVVTGSAETFCAGMDLKDFARGNRPSLPGRGFAGFVEAPPGKPVIAAVEGYALAGGFELVLACDLVVASSTAVFGLPEATRGLVAAGGGLLRLPRKVPRNVALELALTGQRLEAERAYALGLVNRMTAAGAALSGALALADEISANAPLSVTVSKQVIESAVDWPMAEAFDRQRPITEPVFASSDAAEGAAAFAQKRRPEWSGS
jgi:enoyl-CoA hydratase/carnithine racemase